MMKRNLSRLAVLAGVCVLSTAVQAAVIVDDSFADGDFAKTGALDTNWWTSSSSSGKEISVGSLGLVTGTSGRGIHTVFPTQSLLNVGDALKVSYTFTTPATVGTNRSTAFRVGLFDNLGRVEAVTSTDPNTTNLDDDVNAGSTSQNPVYGWGLATGGPGNQPLPGYMFDMDVNNGPSSDLNFREHDQSPATLVGTGRLMGTTTGFSNVSPSGPDEGDFWTPNTQYTGTFDITRISATEVELAGTLNGLSHSTTDEFDSINFGFLGFHVNSNTFGSSNSAGDPDNGIDFSNITIGFHPVPEPASMGLIFCGVLLAGLSRRRR